MNAYRHTLALILCGLHFAAVPLAGQLRFDADFDNGRLDSVTTRGDTLVLWPDVPLHARITGAAGSTPVFAIFRGSDYRMRTRHRMVYRYAGERDWHFCDTGYVRGEWYYFRNDTPFLHDTLYVAYWRPFTYGDLESWMREVERHPHARNAGPRGITARGRAVYGFAVTDTGAADDGKKHVVVIARQHCVEAPGSELLRGMAEYLMQDAGAVATELRARCVFHFYPMASPDPVYHGCDPARGGYGATNRQWSPGYPDSVRSTDPTFETDVLRRAIFRETGGSAWIGIDIHSHPGHIGKWYYWGARSGRDSAAAASLVQTISARDAALHGDGGVLAPEIAQDLHSVSCDCADHWLDETLGALAFTLEPGSVPPQSRSRVEGAGRAICEGIFDRLPPVTSAENAAGAAVEDVTLTAYPAPFRDLLTLRIALPRAAALQVQLRDVLGRTLFPAAHPLRFTAGVHEVPLRTGALPPGPCILTVESAAFRMRRVLLRLP